MIGIMNGMVMQRGGDNTADIYICSTHPLAAVTYTGAADGRAMVEPCGTERYHVTGIPVGGPYAVTVEGETYTDVYVGDVWLLAGQSNMQGVGWLDPEAPDPNPAVRALYMQDFWGPAKDPLHLMWEAKDKVHTVELRVEPPTEELYQGAGPGVSFGQRMYELTGGVPQGLLCCAHGGSSMLHWSEKIRDKGPDYSLYAAMQRRFAANGSHVRGMFWFQGCADAFEQSADVFPQRMAEFMAQFHRDFGAIPTVQVQIARVTHPYVEGLAENWMKVREAQRLMPQAIPHLYTISALDKAGDDLIHLGREAQHQVGIDGAEAMYQALYGTDEQGLLPPIELGEISLWEHPKSHKMMVSVTFCNLQGGLTAQGRPTGFRITEQPYAYTDEVVFDVQLSGDTAHIRTWLDAEQIKDRYLHYGFGLDPYCNLTDAHGRALPAFGPIKLG